MNAVGKVPKLIFLQDYNQARTTEFIDQMSKLKLNNCDPVHLIHSEKSFEPMELRTDVLNFNREYAMNKVLKLLDQAKGSHRHATNASTKHISG